MPHNRLHIDTRPQSKEHKLGTDPPTLCPPLYKVASLHCIHPTTFHGLSSQALLSGMASHYMVKTLQTRLASHQVIWSTTAPPLGGPTFRYTPKIAQRTTPCHGARQCHTTQTRYAAPPINLDKLMKTNNAVGNKWYTDVEY